MDTDIEGQGISKSNTEFEHVAVPHQHKHGPKAYCPSKKRGAKSHSDYHKGIHPLADNGTAVITQPQVLAAREFSPEVEHEHIAVLGGDVGYHGGEYST